MCIYPVVFTYHVAWVVCVFSVVHNAAVNMGAQVFFQDPAFSSFARVSSSRIAGSYDNSIFKCFEDAP